MNKLPINQLMAKVDSKYTLVIVAAKSARQMIEKNPESFSSGKIHPVSHALEDLFADKLVWRRIKDGIK